MVVHKPMDATDASFDKIVGTGVVLVDFRAPSCGPCRAVAPILAGLAVEYGGRLTVAKLNVDENSRTATRYGM
jgi:thioredoxin 1